MRRNFYIILLALISILSGCQKDKFYLFNDIGRIQFGPDPAFLYRSGYELSDTVKSFTFYYEEAAVQKDTVYFDIYTIGGTSPEDRSFKLEQLQIEGVKNAQPGEHFIGFDKAEATKNFIIRADSVHAKLPIILLRSATLKDTNVVLRFQVVDGGDFAIGQQDNLWRQINFTDRLSRPGEWDDRFAKYYFGDYSVIKHQFMIDQTGQRWDDAFITEIELDYGLLQYWKGVCKNLLVKYNNEHPADPLMDEFGQLVLFP